MYQAGFVIVSNWVLETVHPSINRNKLSISNNKKICNTLIKDSREKLIILFIIKLQFSGNEPLKFVFKYKRIQDLHNIVIATIRNTICKQK